MITKDTNDDLIDCLYLDSSDCAIKIPVIDNYMNYLDRGLNSTIKNIRELYRSNPEYFNNFVYFVIPDTEMPLGMKHKKGKGVSLFPLEHYPPGFFIDSNLENPSPNFVSIDNTSFGITNKKMRIKGSICLMRAFLLRQQLKKTDSFIISEEDRVKHYRSEKLINYVVATESFLENYTEE